MIKFSTSDYLPVQKYANISSTFHITAGILLLELAHEKCDIRDIIIRNCIARADMTSAAIFRLWDLQDYQDCWVLFRCLVDRLFHLWQLSHNDEFEIFEEWSFLEQYNALNRARSDPRAADMKDNIGFALTPEHRKRAKALSHKKIEWQRPKAETAAKGLGMQFLYSYGYDYASAYVHPMADDGEQDFFTLTKLKPTPFFRDHRSVLSNTLLVASVLTQEGLNASTLLWHRRIYDLLEDLRRALVTGSDEYSIPFNEIRIMLEKGERLYQIKANSQTV